MRNIGLDKMRGAILGMAQRMGALKRNAQPETADVVDAGNLPVPYNGTSLLPRPAGMPQPSRGRVPPAERVAISDYDCEQEVLAIVYEEILDPGTGAPCTPQIEVRHQADDCATVYLNGLALADVAGAGGLVAEDIALIPR